MGTTSPQCRGASENGGSRTWIFGSPFGTFCFIFVLSFAVRAALLAAWVSNHEDFYRLGGEIGRVALSLLRGGGFADPYMIPTGPTAHPAPFTPALLALIYHAFGMTAAAGYVRALAGIASYSALYALLPWLAGRLGLGARAGMIAGVAAALIPREGLSESIGVGATAQASLGFALLTIGFLHRWAAQRVSVAGSLLLGVACGAAFHLLPPLLLVVLGYLGFEMCWRRTRRQWLLSACVALGALLACVPWTWRNYNELHGLCFIRSNFGLEFRIANQPRADADIEVSWARLGTLRHPSENLDEARQVRALGEAEYNRRARNEALAWMEEHPGELLRLSVFRFLHFWCGPLRYPWLAALFTGVTLLALLGLRRIWPGLETPQRAAVVIPLALFPLVYYVVSYVAHYPAPMGWLLLVLAGAEADGWFNPPRCPERPPDR
ncbi:MAG: hypothetical protein HY821_07245 [Acidobacteria bacterium]|nr:hypothetical protein [Acidobacteriota bacterium]